MLFAQTQQMALGVAGAGGGFLVAYLGLALRYRTALGWLIALAGVGGAGVGAMYSLGFAGHALEMIALGTGVFGIFLATLAVAPLYGAGSRRLSMLASFAVFGAGLVAADFALPPQVLAGAVGAVLVWDLSENSTAMGQQMGRQAGTRRSELTHLIGSSLVGVASASGGYAAYSMGRGLSWALESVVLMLLAIMLLVLFLYR